MVQGLSAPPTGCPLAPIHHEAPALALRVIRGFARMEQGLTDARAFPGGVTAVDVAGLDVLRRAQIAREASDDAVRAKEEKARKLAQEAAKS